MRVKIYNNRFRVFNTRAKYNYPNESKAYVDVIQADVALTATQRLYAHFMIGIDINELLWVLRKAYYLMFGGTASTHKWNAKDLRDLDSAFRLTYAGTLTHSSNGIQGSGGYAETFVNPSISLTLNSTHISAYSRTSSANNINLVGIQDAGGNSMRQWVNYNGVSYSDFYNSGSGRVSGNNTGSKGYFLFNRESSIKHKIFKNGNLISNVGTSTGGSLQNYTLALLAFKNNGGFVEASNLEISIFSIGTGLTDMQSITDSTKTIFGQKILNRA